MPVSIFGSSSSARRFSLYHFQRRDPLSVTMAKPNGDPLDEGIATVAQKRRDNEWKFMVSTRLATVENKTKEQDTWLWNIYSSKFGHRIHKLEEQMPVGDIEAMIGAVQTECNMQIEALKNELKFVHTNSRLEHENSCWWWEEYSRKLELENEKVTLLKVIVAILMLMLMILIRTA